jgi:adenylate cyclase
MNFLSKTYKSKEYFSLHWVILLLAINLGICENGFANQVNYKRIELRYDTVNVTVPLLSGNDSSAYFRAGHFLRVPHRFHSLYIELNKPSDSLLYSFFLEGLSTFWTEWSPYPVKEYIHLSPGRYILNIRVRDTGGTVFELSSFHFHIIKPVFHTTLAIIIYVFLFVFFILFMLRIWSYRFAREKFRLEKIINERTEEMIREKDKTENLLANVLPKDTADELKKDGKAAKKKFKMVTVLFSDIQGFTKIAEQMNPEALIDELDKFFFHFDSVVEKYDIEKIKTIGDAYMCAGGIPNKNRTNPVEVVLAALEMQKYMKDLHEKSKALNMSFFDIRIGIHTGAVIAGVVGHKKLSYDIWGDTVNTASRMESSGEAGKVNVSDSTYELIKDFFICEYRGKMPVKYKGEIDMYFVKGIRPQLAQEDLGMPNEKFLTQLQMLRLLDLEEDLIEKLEKELPANLYFHNVRHTVNVYTQVELLGRALGISDEDMLLLRTAGLLHDAGIIEDYDNHEDSSCELARDLLPNYRFTEQQIKMVCDLIMSTTMPPHPQNLLEMILCDANMDYLGHVDFVEQMKNRFLELKEKGKAVNYTQWVKEQIPFLETHEFYTDIAKKLQDVEKEEQISLLKNSSLE